MHRGNRLNGPVPNQALCSPEGAAIGVEDEHLASNVAAGIIGRLGPRFASRGRTKGTAVIAIPSGERHDLGLAMLADILRSDGYRVHNLGADTPAPALLSALDGVDNLSALALGIVNDERLDDDAALIAAIRHSVGPVPVLVGGAAVDGDQSARHLGADGWARDAREVGPMIAAMSPSRRQGR
jgi:methanogenic corrinoid protein MtbC1